MNGDAKNRERVGIVGTVRTAIGKAGGALAAVEAYELQAAAFRACLDRAAAAGLCEVETRDVLLCEIDDVIVGNVTNSIGNVGRVAALAAGLPESVPAVTVDRQCASSMEALVLAAAKIRGGFARRVLVGGVESASRAPWLYEKTARAYNMAPPQPYAVRFAAPGIDDPPMGETAEILAGEYEIEREEMDAFALESHRRAAAAEADDFFAGERVAVAVPQRRGDPILVENDECVRADANLESMAKLRPAFRKDGRVTAGNSSPINDGAAAALAVGERELEIAGSRPDAWLIDAATVGLEPRRMGLGPVAAIRRLLERNELPIDEIDLFEINEAFAAQILAVNRELLIPAQKLNLHGGAIALGHPLGATGLRIVTTLIHALRARGGRRGVASLCVGGGQGMAVLVELP